MSQQPDEVVAKDGGGNFTPHPEGQFAMVCADVVNLGTTVETYQGSSPREVPKAALVFISGARQADGTLTQVTVEMSVFASDKANLRKFLESWRGRSYNPDQIREGLPLHKLFHQHGLLSIEHITTRSGKLFAKVRSISPLPEQMPKVSAEVLAEYTRPKFLADRKAAYAELLARHRGKGGNGNGHSGNEPPLPDLPPEEDDDLPF